ncbi:MAG: sigma-70 family RNA polymerase sigma factor [Clostridia bacterium]|nr:sigma-70 family RNA polymerase sigma factor [Clostridia bacterium]
MLFLEVLETLEDTERCLVEQLWMDYSGKVKAICMKILCSEDLAQDALNETFLKVIKYKDRFSDTDERERARLIVIYARSVCFTLYRRKNKLKIDSLEELAEEADGEEKLVRGEARDLTEILLRKETSEMLAREIAALPTPTREIVVMKYYYDMRNTEIAEFFGMKPSTVGTVIERANKKLRKKLWGYMHE